MTLNEFRCEMLLYRQSVDDEAKSLKSPYITLDRLRALYGKLDDTERLMANDVLAEWALSEDEGIRFDALALIDELKIETAMPALKGLAARLVSSGVSGAPYELKKVCRIIARLAS
jgi:hypothetical protein